MNPHWRRSFFEAGVAPICCTGYAGPGPGEMASDITSDDRSQASSYAPEFHYESGTDLPHFLRMEVCAFCSNNGRGVLCGSLLKGSWAFASLKSRAMAC